MVCSVQRLLLSSHPKVEARTRSLVDLATVSGKEVEEDVPWCLNRNQPEKVSRNEMPVNCSNSRQHSNASRCNHYKAHDFITPGVLHLCIPTTTIHRASTWIQTNLSPIPKSLLSPLLPFPSQASIPPTSSSPSPSSPPPSH